jgi:hypothetical protein
MKHPNREEWVPYVFGEARGDDAKRLAAHLEGCPECSDEVAGWRRSLNRLDAWALPKTQRERVIIAPIFRWAVAAAIVLAAGIGIGRLTAPDAQTMRTEIEAAVKAAVAAQTQQAINDAEQRIVSVSQAEARDLWRAFSEALADARREERAATLSLFQQLQQEQQAEYVALRRDLETMATVADQEIRLTNLKMTQLAANSPTP